MLEVKLMIDIDDVVSSLVDSVVSHAVTLVMLLLTMEPMYEPLLRYDNGVLK